jgi:signal transduction histidine kinase
MQEAALAEADALSASITAMSRHEAASAHRAARQAAPKWTYLLSGPAIVGPLLSGPKSIIADLRADGGALVCGDACLAVGAAPDCMWLKEAAKDFQAEHEGSVFTDRLSELEGLAATPAAAGAMIARIESDPPITLFVFRRAQIQEVHWGGDPKTAVTVSPNGKPSPRQSFARWRDLVRDRARPWSARERNVFAACLGALKKQVTDRKGVAADLPGELRAVAEGYSDMADSHRLLVDALPEGVAVLLWSVHYTTERLHYANRAFTNLFGLDAADVVGRDPDHVFQRTQIDRALLECSDGEEREMDVWSSTLGVRRIRARRETLMHYYGPDGEISIDSLLLSDTTGAARSQEALLAAVRQAEAAESARGALLRNMSHELRTPLNAIVGYSDMLAQELVGPLGDPSYIAAAEEIRSAAGHLLDLINDTLEVARLKSGKARIDPSRHDVGGIVSSATRLLRELAASRQVELITDIPTKPVFAIVDNLAFRQIVINLVNNAIKFTTEGGKVNVILAYEDDGSVVLSVVDTGIGIAPEEVGRLFTPFSQVDSTIGRPRGGSGLGLAIVKELIQLHGGKIELVSVEGLGSTFTVRLPAWRVETSE